MPSHWAVPYGISRRAGVHTAADTNSHSSGSVRRGLPRPHGLPTKHVHRDGCQAAPGLAHICAAHTEAEVGQHLPGLGPRPTSAPGLHAYLGCEACQKHLKGSMALADEHRREHAEHLLQPASKTLRRKPGRRWTVARFLRSSLGPHLRWQRRRRRKLTLAVFGRQLQIQRENPAKPDGAIPCGMIASPSAAEPTDPFRRRWR